MDEDATIIKHEAITLMENDNPLERDIAVEPFIVIPHRTPTSTKVAIGTRPKQSISLQ